MDHRPDADDGIVQTVTGPVSPNAIGICDAHNHLWIEPVNGSQPGTPILNDYEAIASELRHYRQVGGTTIVDCQPAGCGRNGAVLQRLARETGVYVVAATGFHLPKYYGPDPWIYRATASQAKEFFTSEIRSGLEECAEWEQPVRAGVIKIACQSRLQDTPQALLEAAASACLETGIAIEAHTERGSEAELLVEFFLRQGVHAARLVICHIDKRPDFGLHRDLASMGVLLEYDTFYRPKYDPEKNLWPLLRGMLEHGFEESIALATDMAEPALWSLLGGPGLVGFPTIIASRLTSLDQGKVSRKLLGGNIAGRLALPVPIH